MIKHQHTKTPLDYSRSITVAIILPALNESPTIKETIRDFILHFTTAHIVVVDNNSSDDTAKIALEELRPTDYLLSQPLRGKARAVRLALERVVADVYVLCDADATYSAESALELMREMLISRSDMVVGSRMCSGAFSAQNQRAGH